MLAFNDTEKPCQWYSQKDTSILAVELLKMFPVLTMENLTLYIWRQFTCIQCDQDYDENSEPSLPHRRAPAEMVKVKQCRALNRNIKFQFHVIFHSFQIKSKGLW
jgi:hypothetical protein